MILLESSKSGYTYIGNDNNYYSVIRNDDCGAPDEIYPLVLGPITPQEFDEIPLSNYYVLESLCQPTRCPVWND